MNLLDILGTLAFYVPFLAIGAILAFNRLRVLKRNRADRSSSSKRAVRGSLVAEGVMFQHLQVFFRPSMAYVLEAEQDESADEDESGEPESPLAAFHRQLRRIRRGEQVDRLVLRL
jgi:hypothetical protein